ncbi:MAG: ATP-binding cassette domain-containing protein [Mariprofundaceae bacterium]|nr:ATP-binding cassette domain-containing protein [Mariprofundaceae bacterium]
MIHSIAIRQQFGALLLNVTVKFDNEIIVISGENGAGKTTLLRCMAGLEKVSGIIKINKKIWLNSAAKIIVPTTVRNIAFVWSDAVLLPWLNIEDNIILGGKNDAALLAFICSECGINHLRHRIPSMLSSGEAQRVALARAIYRKPCLLLLDEPFSAQAPSIRCRLRIFLQNIQQQWAIPILIASHDPEDARVLAQQHWDMQEGSIVVVNSSG